MLTMLLGWFTGIPGAIWGVASSTLNWFGELTLQAKEVALATLLIAGLLAGYTLQIHIKNHEIATLSAHLTDATAAIAQRDEALKIANAETIKVRATLDTQNAAIKALRAKHLQAQFDAEKRLNDALAHPPEAIRVNPGFEEMNRWLVERFSH